MTRVRVENLTISLDGYGAGQDQGFDNPLGIGGEALHDWLISTRAWRRMHGQEGGASVCLWYDGDAEEAARFYAETNL